VGAVPQEVAVRADADGVVVTGSWPQAAGARLRAGVVETTIEPDGQFTLQLPSQAPGVARLALTVVQGQRRQVVPTTITVHYRITPEAVGPAGILGAVVETRPGWRVTSPRSTALAPGRHRVEVDVAKALDDADAKGLDQAPFDFVLVLSGPDGALRRFTETLTIPVPSTPLTLAGPARGVVTTTDVLQFRGRTTPRARVVAGGQRGRADHQGRFSLHVPIEVVGAQSVTVEVDAVGTRPRQMDVDVVRVSARAAKRQRRRLLKRAREVHPKAKRKVRYSALRRSENPLTGRSVRLGGVVLEVRRDLGDRDVVLFSLCRDLARCPVWLETSEPILVGQGEPAIVYGRLGGAVEYVTEQGQKRAIPRLEDAILIP